MRERNSEKNKEMMNILMSYLDPSQNIKKNERYGEI
jgi:hypothetical protein